ncbi:myxosortase-dependent metalloprotease, MXAN_2677/MXAN_2678 family [Hyalangium versicolor]|uniref:myxosortase-dependent metalloprotease, MXAN_2677/MXAN_2678 family n=1 Tax=Hyalangium versicolor TaxID=2861190 RepID=UPI001CCD3F32|nr:myxosortase-dependent metalloprotease, MXAN_2677/MXAN_2678 family [Hyalangium versicolor]
MSHRGLLLLAVLCVAPTAGAQSYRRTVVPGQPLCLNWLNRDFVYHVNAAGSLRTPRDTEFSAIDASFDSWRTLSATCSDFTFVRGEDVSNPTVGYKVGEENQNIVTFREKACSDVVPYEDPCIEAETCGNDYSCWEHGDLTIGLTTTTFSFKTGVILDADIELNASQPGGNLGFLFTTVSSPICEGLPSPECVATDVQNTMTHEIGHAIGLDHVFEPFSTMEASAPLGETQKRIIDAGSAAGFCDTYPRGLPPTQCTEALVPNRTLSGQNAGTRCAVAPGSLLPGVLAALWLLRARRARQSRV